MKLSYKILAALVLIALPIVGRWAWFHRGSYTPPIISEIDEGNISPIRPEYQPIPDDPQPGEGRVLIDLAHNNNLEVNDLTPLRHRLEARGVSVENFEADSGSSLEVELRGVTALVVLVPTSKYTVEEQNAIKAFVKDGGRLLLAADPTRPVPIPEEEVNLFTVSFPTSAIPAINSLATVFGVVYFDDYLYNIVANEGNYRNIKLVNFYPESPLTRNLKTVVFFASHSLRSDGTPIISGDENTLSPVRRGESSLAAAALTADEQVLALGDITFLTPSYHTVADNDRFLSHIADWLSGAERQRDLEDFPYLFEGPVDLVQVAGEYLDPRLIAGISTLQEVFEQADLSLTVRAEADPTHDALLVGTFDETEQVQSYLATSGISITLFITSTETMTDSAGVEGGLIEPTATTTVTTTPALTATEQGETPETAPEVQLLPEPGAAIPAASTEEGKPGQGFIEIEGLGTIQIEGTSLFLVDRQNGRVVVSALAEDGETLTKALDNLVSGNLSGCMVGDPVTVCSTGTAPEEPATGTDLEGAETGGDAAKSRVFILSDDDGPDGRRTGAVELEAILGSVYTVTVWSTSRDGIPTADDVTGHNVYIIDSGDYAYDQEDTETLTAFNGLESNVLFIGEQPFPSFDPQPNLINDLQVADVSHPIAFGFEAEQVIILEPSESGVPAVVIPPAPGVYDSTDIIFNRGPNSAEAGRPAMIAATETQSGRHIILATFAFYRLPEDIQRLFALNTVKWLLEQ